MIHDLHLVAGVDAAQVDEHLEVERGIVVQHAERIDGIRERDANLCLVVSLAHRRQESLAETLLQVESERAIHGAPRSPLERWGQSPAPPRGRDDP